MTRFFDFQALFSRKPFMFSTCLKNALGIIQYIRKCFIRSEQRRSPLQTLNQRQLIILCLLLSLGRKVLIGLFYFIFPSWAIFWIPPSSDFSESSSPP